MSSSRRGSQPKDPAAVLRGRMGGLTRAATAPTPQAITEAARNARWQRYLDKVPPEFTDPADRQRRAELLRRADMIRLSALAAKARRLRAQASAVEEQAEVIAEHVGDTEVEHDLT